jgi:uncharacterized membrane protein
MSENQTKSQPLERLIIWPHRSLSPKGFAIVIGVLAGLLFTIGLGFFWQVLGQSLDFSAWSFLSFGVRLS